VEIVDNIVGVELDSSVEVAESVVGIAVVGAVVAAGSGEKDLIASAADFENCGKRVAGIETATALLDYCTYSDSLPVIVVEMDCSESSYLKVVLAAAGVVAVFVALPAVAKTDYSLYFAEAVARDFRK
jgi:hypothetical protein